MKKNLDLFIEELKKEEVKFRNKMIFCKEHEFKEEERLLRIKMNILSEIRSEAENIKTSENYNPKFFF